MNGWHSGAENGSIMKLSFIRQLVFPVCLLLAAWPSAARSGKPLFLVYSVEGQAGYRATGAAIPHALMRNAPVFAGDRLSLTGTGASVILIAENTDYIRLNKPGDYDAETIQKMQRSQWKDDVSVKYFHLLWEEFFKPRPVTGHLDPATIAGSTGGVMRGSLQLLAPATVFRTSMDEQLFRWTGIPGATGYVFSLSDETRKTVLSRTVSDTVLLLVLKNSLHAGERYRWSLGYLSPKGSDSAVLSGELEWIDETATLAGLDLSLPDVVPGPVAMLQRASLLESAGCTKAAMESYERLVRNNPGDGALMTLQTDFLIRNGLPE